jgi:hypothetical protein
LDLPRPAPTQPNEPRNPGSAAETPPPPPNYTEALLSCEASLKNYASAPSLRKPKIKIRVSNDSTPHAIATRFGEGTL